MRGRGGGAGREGGVVPPAVNLEPCNAADALPVLASTGNSSGNPSLHGPHFLQTPELPFTFSNTRSRRTDGEGGGRGVGWTGTRTPRSRSSLAG